MSYIGAQPSTSAFPFQQFSGNGSTTTFTLSYSPASTTSIIVYVNGIIQNPNTYTVSGLTLTFNTAPASGTDNIGILFLGLVASSIVGTVTSVGATTPLSSSGGASPNISLSGQIAIANGGTGQSTAVAAFDALSPTTTKGDLIVSNGTDNVRQAVGTNDQVLVADSTVSTGVKWAGLGSLGGGFSNMSVFEYTVIQGSMTGTTLNVTTLYSGQLRIGSIITGPGISASTITAFGTGTGGAGSYTMSVSQTRTSIVMYSTTTTYSIPSNVSKMKVTVVGAGGGGGAGVSTISGGGGGGGGTAIQILSGLTSGLTLALTVGVGGQGGTGAAGAAGGTTSIASGTQTITTVSATGGAGGTYNTNAASLGGVGSGGLLNINGGTSICNGAMAGGSSYLGGGGTPTTGAGGTGGKYGGGGAGGTYQGTASGGFGANGVIVIEY